MHAAHTSPGQFNQVNKLFTFFFQIRQRYYQVLCAVTNSESRSPTHSTGTGKKEQRRSTFNSLVSFFCNHQTK